MVQEVVETPTSPIQRKQEDSCCQRMAMPSSPWCTHGLFVSPLRKVLQARASWEIRHSESSGLRLLMQLQFGLLLLMLFLVTKSITWWDSDLSCSTAGSAVSCSVDLSVWWKLKVIIRAPPVSVWCCFPWATHFCDRDNLQTSTRGSTKQQKIQECSSFNF